MFIRKALGILIFAMVGITTVAWLTFSWFEAGTEVEILCSNFHAGLSEQSVLQTLETGEYLRYQIISNAQGKRIEINSLYNLGSSNCIVEFTTDGTVFQARLE